MTYKQNIVLSTKTLEYVDVFVWVSICSIWLKFFKMGSNNIAKWQLISKLRHEIWHTKPCGYVIHFYNGAVATCLMMVYRLAACFAVLFIFITTSNQRIRRARLDNQFCQYDPETEPSLIHVLKVSSISILVTYPQSTQNFARSLAATAERWLQDSCDIF